LRKKVKEVEANILRFCCVFFFKAAPIEKNCNVSTKRFRNEKWNKTGCIKKAS
jgi:hypothetical protein